MIVLQSTATGMAEQPVVHLKSAAGMSSPAGELCDPIGRTTRAFSCMAVPMALRHYWLTICVSSVRICGSMSWTLHFKTFKNSSNHARLKPNRVPGGPQKRSIHAAGKSQTIVFGQFTKTRNSTLNRVEKTPIL